MSKYKSSFRQKGIHDHRAVILSYKKPLHKTKHHYFVDQTALDVYNLDDTFGNVPTSFGKYFPAFDGLLIHVVLDKSKRWETILSCLEENCIKKHVKRQEAYKPHFPDRVEVVYTLPILDSKLLPSALRPFNRNVWRGVNYDKDTIYLRSGLDFSKLGKLKFETKLNRLFGSLKVSGMQCTSQNPGHVSSILSHHSSGGPLHFAEIDLGEINGSLILVRWAKGYMFTCSLIAKRKNNIKLKIFGLNM